MESDVWIQPEDENPHSVLSLKREMISGQWVDQLEEDGVELLMT